MARGKQRFKGFGADIVFNFIAQVRGMW